MYIIFFIVLELVIKIINLYRKRLDEKTFYIIYQLF